MPQTTLDTPEPQSRAKTIRGDATDHLEKAYMPGDICTSKKLSALKPWSGNSTVSLYEARILTVLLHDQE